MSTLSARLGDTLQTLRNAGTYKELRNITAPMAPTTVIEGIGEVLVFCSNNYLGLADHPEVVEAGIAGLRKYGAGTASVRFGTAVAALPVDLEPFDDRLEVVVGPVTGPQGGYVPEGTEVVVNGEVAVVRDGRARVTLPAGTISVEVGVLGTTVIETTSRGDRE